MVNKKLQVNWEGTQITSIQRDSLHLWCLNFFTFVTIVKKVIILFYDGRSGGGILGCIILTHYDLYNKHEVKLLLSQQILKMY